MQIIKITPTENGGRPPIQSWSRSTPPDGYAIVQCDTAVFYEFKGFVNCTFEDIYCTSMTGNQEALDAYEAEHPEPEPVDPEPTDTEVLNALLGVTE